VTAPTHSETTREKTITVATTSGTTLGNATNTIYEADPDEVLYVADAGPVETWDGIGRTAETVTRTTIYPITSAFDVIPVAQTQAASTLTNPSFSSSISWKSTTFTTATVTANNIGALPHSSTTQTLPQTITTESSTSSSLQAGFVIHSGDTYTLRRSQVFSTTVSKYIGSLEFESIFTYFTLITQTSRYSGAFTTGETAAASAGSASGSTKNIGGQQTRAINAARMGIARRASSARWSVYGIVGVLGQDGAGASYTFTDNISFVSQAKAQRRFFGPLTIFPATNERYTANRTGLTWKTDDSTTSGAIEADGEPRTQLLFLNERSGLLGGALAESETAVQRVARGLYRDAEGQTTFFEGHDTSYTDSTRENTHYAPKRFQELGPLPVLPAERNSVLLPNFISAQGNIYEPIDPPDEEDESL
jgi:hypothetical protein